MADLIERWLAGSQPTELISEWIERMEKPQPVPPPPGKWFMLPAPPRMPYQVINAALRDAGREFFPSMTHQLALQEADRAAVEFERRAAEFEKRMMEVMPKMILSPNDLTPREW